MILKKSFITVGITAALILGGSGCGKKFLDIPPQGELTEEQALVDPGAAEKMVTGVYNTLYFGGFGNNTVGFLWTLLTNVASDDAEKGSTASDFGAAAEIEGFTFNANNSIFNSLWSGHYQAITRANKAIALLDAATFDEVTRKRLTGEVRFLRGMFYFNLVRLFGGVPKLIRVPDPSEGNSDEFQTRATKADIYAVIVADLQYGVDNLPLKGDAGSSTGRATKGAAQGLLAKVYLYLGDWQKAFDNSLAVINSNKYSLADDYAGMFREVGVNNSESMFEVQTGIHRGTDNCDAVSNVYSNAQGPRAKAGWTNNVDGKQYDGDLGFGFNIPSANLAAAYEAGDVRRAGTIIFVNPTVAGPNNNPGTRLWDGFRLPTQDSVENSRYNYKAYHSPFKETASCNGYLDKDLKPKNIRVLRYADVLLIYAEAAAMLGQADGVNKLNAVRAKRNLGATTLSQANVLQERRVELGMEGERFFDLVRTNGASTVLNGIGIPFVAGKHEVFPIPQAQRDLSGGRLAQNPNY